MLLLEILLGILVFGYIAGCLFVGIGLSMSVMSNLKKDNPEDEIDTIEIIIEKVNKDDNKEGS